MRGVQKGHSRRLAPVLGLSLTSGKVHSSDLELGRTGVVGENRVPKNGSSFLRALKSKKLIKRHKK